MHRLAILPVTLLAICMSAGCGSSRPHTVQTGSVRPPVPPREPVATGCHRRPPSTRADWPRFGIDAQRSGVFPASTGITAANLHCLHRRRLRIDGTVDSSPIFLHGVLVKGRTRDVFVVTTTYGKTLALDAMTGAVVWRFEPPGIAGWQGGPRITTTTPVADPDRRDVYAAAPDGRIHKLSVSDGHEIHSAGWPATLTYEPTHEKLASALNVSGRYVIAVTGGYIGDAPPYQGHVVTIDRQSGRIAGVFNSLCSNRRTLISPPSCPASGSAIWARAGAVVEPGSGRLLVATGNGPYDGRQDWGQSVLELSPDARTLRQAYTPSDYSALNASDSDLGSTAPALLSAGDSRLALQGGKDSKLRLLDLARLNGRGTTPAPVTAGEAQILSTPGGEKIFTAPAVCRRGGRTLVFVTDGAGTEALTVSGSPPRLRAVWHNGTSGTSPVIAGGLLYVYDADDGALNVYDLASGHRLARLSAATGHWNSPIVADGRVLLPEGNANDHAESGTLSLYAP